MATLKICRVENCTKTPRAFGLCSAHYTRMRRNGSPTAGQTGRGEAAAWLLAHVEYKGDECLTWPYAKSGTGYGLTTYNGRQTNASRVMCVLAHGEPPNEKMDAAHSCGKGHLGCVNPVHLRWATRSQNHADKLIHGTHAKGENHPRRKLSESEVKSIRSLEGNAPALKLASEYGISVAMVYRIWRRQAWAHV